MQPAGRAAEVAGLDGVVADIGETIAGGVEPLQHARRDQLSIRTRPRGGVIVTLQIARGIGRAYRDTTHSVSVHVLSEDRFAEAARAAMDAKVDGVASE